MNTILAWLAGSKVGAAFEKTRGFLSGKKTYLSMAAKASIGLALCATATVCLVEGLVAAGGLAGAIGFFRNVTEHPCAILFMAGAAIISDAAGGASLRSAISKAEAELKKAHPAIDKLGRPLP